jgi:hypothetical protein
VCVCERERERETLGEMRRTLWAHPPWTLSSFGPYFDVLLLRKPREREERNCVFIMNERREWYANLDWERRSGEINEKRHEEDGAQSHFS